MHKGGTKLLLKAILRLWISDGRPLSSQEMIEHYANALKACLKNTRRKEWYNQARRVTNEKVESHNNKNL